MIPVIWHKQRMLCNDQTFLNEILSEYSHFSGEWPISEYAVIIVPGRLSLEDIPFLNTKIQQYKGIVIFVIGDEESLFPVSDLKHQNMRLWVMSPVRGKHTPPRFVINGSQPNLHSILQTLSKEKTKDWFFAGQITHSRRRECAAQLRNMPNGCLLETAGFMQGMPYFEYLKKMASAKFIPCPSGPIELSTARIFEALEAGCVPIVDEVVPPENVCDRLKQNTGPGYWKWFFGEQPPFPVIHDWKALPELINDLLPTWDSIQKNCYEWWTAYKTSFKNGIEKDIWDIQQ